MQKKEIDAKLKIVNSGFIDFKEISTRREIRDASDIPTLLELDSDAFTGSNAITDP